MKLIQTDLLGFGIGYDFKLKQLSIHLLFWCLDIKLKK